MKTGSRRLKLARRAANTQAWHDAMGAAPDPNSFIARRGAKTWDQLAAMCEAMTAEWESWPEARRRAYAFPNPEDR